MKTIFLIFFVLSPFFSIAQTPGEWTWMKGSNTPQAGVFGIQGVPDPLNEPPGSYGASFWNDTLNNLWMYGGAATGCLSDLWKLNISTLEWTWMNGNAIQNALPVFGTRGVAAPANSPGGRAYGAPTWTDLSGNLWLFGGYDSSLYVGNDLWKYDVTTNMWTWMNGDSAGASLGNYGIQGVPSPSNQPPSRSDGTTTWIDSAGNLWMFGGFEWISYFLNDLWKYDPSTNEWTWMHGSSAINAASVYGTKGIPAPANVPGARFTHAHWTDLNGKFWTYGGMDTSNNPLSDLWKYDLLSNEWTWMHGTGDQNNPGHYGTRCVADTANLPMSRYENRACWTDRCGNFWMMGGYHSVPGFFIDDLWLYEHDLNQWVWVSNDSLTNQFPSFGILGVSSPANHPGGRGGASSVMDSTGNLWICGGSVAGTGGLADLWRFVPDPACGKCNLSFPIASCTSTDTLLCPGSCTSFLNLSTNANSFQWFFAGATPDTSTATNPTNICYANPGTYDLQLIASNANGNDTLLITNYITVYPPPPPQSISQSGDTLFANGGSASYQWFYNGNIISGATDYFYVATASGDYNVVATDANGCEVEAAIFSVLASTQSLVMGHWSLYPNPVSDKLIIYNSQVTSETAVEISIYDVFGVLVVQLPTAYCLLPTCQIDVSNLPSGLYYIEIKSSGKTYRAKFVKQ